MERVLVLLLIVLFVLVLGVSLRSLQLYRPFGHISSATHTTRNEGFLDMDTLYERNYEDAKMSGYVTTENGDEGDVYRPENGEYHSQLSNVPTLKEYIIGRLKRYESRIPLKHSDKHYSIRFMVDEILKKFTRGSNPDVVLNPDSRIEDQITCDIADNCDEYVRNSQLYCPIGVGRLKNRESTGTENETKYQGCYTLFDNYTPLACRFGDRFNYCDYLTDLRIQKVGGGILVLPTHDAMKSELDKVESDIDKFVINFIMEIKIYVVRYLILTYDRKDVKDNFDKIQKWTPKTTTGSAILDQYAMQVYHNTFILVQGRTSKTPRRIGFIMRKNTDTPISLQKGYIPELSTPTTRHSYNLKNKGYIHDTTMDPMPKMERMINRPKRRGANMTSDTKYKSSSERRSCQD